MKNPIAVSISNDDNHYTTGTVLLLYIFWSRTPPRINVMSRQFHMILPFLLTFIFFIGSFRYFLNFLPGIFFSFSLIFPPLFLALFSFKTANHFHSSILRLVYLYPFQAFDIFPSQFRFIRSYVFLPHVLHLFYSPRSSDPVTQEQREKKLQI